MDGLELRVHQSRLHQRREGTSIIIHKTFPVSQERTEVVRQWRYEHCRIRSGTRRPYPNRRRTQFPWPFLFASHSGQECAMNPQDETLRDGEFLDQTESFI